MVLGAVIFLALCFILGYFIGRAESMETDVLYVKERLYRLIKNKCYRNPTGETVYCGNRYIIDFSGELYMQTKGGYKKCMSQK